MSKEMYRTKNVGRFPDKITEIREYYDRNEDGSIKSVIKEEVVLHKKDNLRYGTNPHQPAAFFVPEGPSLMADLNVLKSGKNGLSQTNLEDMDRGMRIIRLLGYELPSCSIHKHINPCGVAQDAAKEEPLSGVALGSGSIDAFQRAYWCDERSAFGGTIVFNHPVDGKLADAIMSQDFFECVLAPEIGADALDVLRAHKKYGRNLDIRVVTYNKELLGDIPAFSGELPEPKHIEIKVLFDGSRIYSTPFTTRFKSPEFAPGVAKDKEGKILATSCRAPTPEEAQNLLFAWYVCANVRSNGVVFAKDFATVAIGTGQQERVGAIEQAVQKAYQKAEARLASSFMKNRGRNPTEEEHEAIIKASKTALKGSVLASDGFMPSTDNIETIANTGVTAIIQPGGSNADKAVIEAANARNIAMVVTEERCFSHF